MTLENISDDRNFNEFLDTKKQELCIIEKFLIIEKGNSKQWIDKFSFILDSGCYRLVASLQYSIQIINVWNIYMYIRCIRNIRDFVSV